MDATSDTGRRRAGAESGEPNAAARLGRDAGFAPRGSAGLWPGAFDAARRRASSGGGQRGWNGRRRAPGGEVLRESENNDDMARFWANRRAGRGLRGVGNAAGLSP